MRLGFRTVLAGTLVLLAVAGCTAVTGKTLGQNIDDASITTAVKTKLVGEGVATLTRIDVDTNQGVVYLNGTVQDAAMKRRAGELAWTVKGVRDVINNLKIEGA